MSLFNNILNKIYEYEKKNGTQLLTSYLKLLKISITKTNFDKLLYSILTQTNNNNKSITKYYLEFNNYVLNQDNIKFNKIYKIFLNKNKNIKEKDYIIYKDIIEIGFVFIKNRGLKTFDKLYENIILFFTSEKFKNTNKIKIPYDDYTNKPTPNNVIRGMYMYSFIIYCQIYFKVNDNMILDIKESPYNIYISFEEQLQFQKDNNKIYDNDIINYSFCNKLCFNSTELNGRKKYDYLKLIKDNFINNIIYNKILELFEINKFMIQDNTNFRNLDFFNILQTVTLTKTKITNYFQDSNNIDILKFLIKTNIIDYIFYKYYSILIANNATSTNNMSKILWIILISRIYIFHTSLNYEDFVFKIKKYMNHILNIYIIYISNIINYNKINKSQYKISILIPYYNNLVYRVFESYYNFSILFFSITNNIQKDLHDLHYLETYTKEYNIDSFENLKYIQNIFKNYLIYLVLQKNNQNNYIPFIYNIIITQKKLYVNFEKIYSNYDYKSLNNNKNNKIIGKKGLQLLNIINTESFVNMYEYKRIDVILIIIRKICEMLQDIQNSFTFFSHNNLDLFNIYYDININVHLTKIYIKNCYLVNLEESNFSYNNIYYLSYNIKNHDECLQNESFYNTIDMTQFLYKFIYTLMENISNQNNLKNNIIKYICQTSDDNYVDKIIKNINDLFINKNKINNQSIYDIIQKYDELIKPSKIHEFICTKIFSFTKNKIILNDNILLISNDIEFKKQFYKSLQDNNEAELLDFSELNIKFIPKYILNIIDDFFIKINNIYLQKSNKIYS